MTLSTDVLRFGGLEIMERSRLRMKRDTSKRGQVYVVAAKGSVRLRTSNDRNMPCKGSTPNPKTWRLDIEGTDYILWVTPTERRGVDRLEAYLIPTTTVVAKINRTHEFWLRHEANTKGANQTPALILDKAPPGDTELLRDQWAEFRIGEVEVHEVGDRVG